MANATKLTVHPDRLLPSEPALRDIARELYTSVKDLPIISPHGHVPARWLAARRTVSLPLCVKRTVCWPMLWKRPREPSAIWLQPSSPEHRPSRPKP